MYIHIYQVICEILYHQFQMLGKILWNCKRFKLGLKLLFGYKLLTIEFKSLGSVRKKKYRLNWSKLRVKTFVMLQNIYISNKYVLLNVMFIKDQGFRKYITVFNILQWFLKDHVTLETGVMMLKIQLYYHILNFQIYSNRKQLF